MSQAQVAVRESPHALALGYLQFTSNLASASLGIGLSTLLGFSPLPHSFPLIEFAQTHVLGTWLIGGLLVVLMLIAMLIQVQAPATRRTRAALGTRLARFSASTLVSAVGSGILGILFGLGNLPSDLPLLQLIRTHPPLGIGLVGLLLALIICAPLFAFGSPGPTGGGRAPRNAPLLLSIATSAVSSLLFLALLGTVIARPAWCPTSICPAPVVAHPAGAAYDANLEIFPVAVQSATFAIPGSPDQYSIQQQNLPRQIEATRIDVQSPPLRLVVGVHSLVRGAHEDLLVEQVEVLIDEVTELPSPLNVWSPGSTIDYTTDPVQATYRGEPAGARLQATSTLTPPALLHLNPGESDQIDVQMVSQKAAQLKVRIAVAYHLTTQAATPMLTLAQSYTVAFSTAANWHLYSVQEGHLVPAP